MTKESDKFWFPAKRYGWGWGFPTRWQGWLVMLAYFALIGVGVAFLHRREEPALFIVYVLVLSTVLLAICWFKGEPPRWRWGGE